MQLTNQPWIPILDQHGNASLASLLDIFDESSPVRDLAVRPHERIALYRLLICIVQAALDGPDIREQWEECLSEIGPASRKYLEKWQHRFKLFDTDQPFLQCAGLTKPAKPSKKSKPAVVDAEEEEGAKVSKLDFALSTGANTTLFDHGAATDQPRTFTSAQAALMLLTFQSFSPGGRIGVARWNGQDTPGKGSSSHAPCTPKAMLHSFVRKETLIATLHSNLLTKRDAVSEGLTWGRPLWEMPPDRFQNDEAIANATSTYLGRLVPMTRATLLSPDCSGMVLANGLTYPSFPEYPAETSAATIIRNDNQRGVLGAGDRAIWRELPAILMRRKAGSVGGPATLEKIDYGTAFDLWIGAFQTDKATILDTVESVFHVPPRLMSDPGRLAYEHEIVRCGSIARNLESAILTYRQCLDLRLNSLKPYELKKLKYREKTSALALYWTSIEQAVPLLHAHFQAPENSPEADEALAKWHRTLRQSARDAYTVTCPSETPRQRRAHVLGLNRLNYRHKQPTNL